MSDALGPCAQRLGGIAARRLGWRPAEFWGATPAELIACLVPPDAAADVPVGRTDLLRMMETDDDRCG